MTAGTLPLLTEEGIKSGQKQSHSTPLLCCAPEKACFAADLRLLQAGARQLIQCCSFVPPSFPPLSSWLHMAPLQSWVIVSICFTSCFYQQSLLSLLLLPPINYQSLALPPTSKHLTSASTILLSSVSTLKSSDGGRRSSAHPSQRTRDTGLFLEQVHCTVFWLFLCLVLSPAS